MSKKIIVVLIASAVLALSSGSVVYASEESDSIDSFKGSFDSFYSEWQIVLHDNINEVLSAVQANDELMQADLAELKESFSGLAESLAYEDADGNTNLHERIANIESMTSDTYDLLESRLSELLELVEQYQTEQTEREEQIIKILEDVELNTRTYNTSFDTYSKDSLKTAGETKTMQEEYLAYVLIFVGILVGVSLGNIFSRYFKHE